MYIIRDIEGTIRRYLNTPEIIALVGPRQAGKTTLLQRIHEGLKDSIFITFEDLEIRALFDRDIKAFIEIYVRPYKYIFIDEFHYATEGGQALKFIYDTVKGKKIILSGSSVLELTIKAVRYLTGRILVFPLYPLSFREFFRFRAPELYEYCKKEKGYSRLNDTIVTNIRRLIEEFILYGGYPRVVISKDVEERKLILKNILNIYLLKDVKDIVGIAEDYRIFNLIKALAVQTGSIISYQELCTTTQQTFSTLKRYLNLLEKTYVVNFIRPFFSNRRTEIVKNPKVYFLDTGLRNSVLRDFNLLWSRHDRGVLLENFIFSEIFKKERLINYWRTKSGAEIDFIIDERIPVEVKSTLAGYKIGKPLFSFIEKYHPERAYIFNDNLTGKKTVNSTSVYFVYHHSVIFDEMFETV